MYMCAILNVKVYYIMFLGSWVWGWSGVMVLEFAVGQGLWGSVCDFRVGGLRVFLCMI